MVPWGYFLDAKNHNPMIFSRKITGLRYRNLAVKEKFELQHIFAIIHALRNSRLLSAIGRKQTSVSGG
jgi:Mor family transcriptional regulator